jgi:hypothetical protein
MSSSTDWGLILQRRASEPHFMDALYERGVAVGSLKVVWVGRFLPGGEDSYASAYVITSRDTTSNRNKRFCTNLLIRPDSDRWFFVSGHYDLTWDEAVADLATR